MKTVVSVVIPYYHGSRFIPQILQMMSRNAEVMRQGCQAEMEVLIVNDSPEEELRIEKPVPFKLRVLTNPENSGIHATRVHGLREAEGEFVLFLDQDDRITDICLESQLRHIGTADIVIGNGYDEEPGGGKHLIFSNARRQQAAASLNCHYYYNNLIRSPGQVLIRKSAIPEYWSEQIMTNNGSDDAFLWILMFCKGCKAVVNEDIVYEHVFTGENASGNDASMLRSQMEVTEYLKGIASPIGLWAFRRRAAYYCTDGSRHRLLYPDVGLLRMLYSKLVIRV